MKITMQVDRRAIGSGNVNKTEAFRTLLVDTINHRLAGELPDSLGGKLEGVSVEVGDYGFINVEGKSGVNADLVKQVISDLVQTTKSESAWRR